MTVEEDIDALNKKMDSVLKVIQDFGLNFIQNIGGLKHSLGMINERVENIEKNMLYIKGLGVKIEEMTKIKEDLSSEMKYIESLIKANSLSNISKTITVDPHVTGLSSANTVLEDFQNGLCNYTAIITLTNDLEEVKKTIFEITGGHRILLEINNEIKSLKKESDINEEIVNNLREKIQFWINKL